jgi:hypothetical protein
LVDGIDFLLQPITNLMDLINNQQKVSDQWLDVTTIPVYKIRDLKGSSNEIGSYRPTANLCAVSKVFEKLIH